MPDREREVLAEPPSVEYLQRRAAEGWRIHAIEWERGERQQHAEAAREEVPYGMRVAGDCRHLEEDPA